MCFIKFDCSDCFNNCAHKVEPSWRMMDYLMYGTMRSALELDSFFSSHPINVQVDHADRISEIFDQISYDKGN